MSASTGRDGRRHPDRVSTAATGSFGAPAPAGTATGGTVASGPVTGGVEPLKILVADDEPAMVGVIGAILGSAGHRIIAAYDGREAIKRFEEEHPDLVLLDLAMPGVDGADGLSPDPSRRGHAHRGRLGRARSRGHRGDARPGRRRLHPQALPRRRAAGPGTRGPSSGGVGGPRPATGGSRSASRGPLEGSLVPATTIEFRLVSPARRPPERAGTHQRAAGRGLATCPTGRSALAQVPHRPVARKLVALGAPARCRPRGRLPPEGRSSRGPIPPVTERSRRPHPRAPRRRPDDARRPRFNRAASTSPADPPSLGWVASPQA